MDPHPGSLRPAVRQWTAAWGRVRRSERASVPPAYRDCNLPVDKPFGTPVQRSQGRDAAAAKQSRDRVGAGVAPLAADDDGGLVIVAVHSLNRDESAREICESCAVGGEPVCPAHFSTDHRRGSAATLRAVRLCRLHIRPSPWPAEGSDKRQTPSGCCTRAPGSTHVTMSSEPN